MQLWTHEVVHVVKIRKPYGFWKFMGDMLMIVLTGGLWLIWMIIRHIHNH